MHEILFRGKRIYNGEWVQGIYYPEDYTGFSFPDGIDYYIIPCIPGCKSRIQVIPETIGQFTGLTDKNGNKIFEGDIVKTKYGRLCIVTWFISPAFVGFDLKPIEDKHLIPTKWDLYESENLEIVGNIHDNSELLKEES